MIPVRAVLEKLGAQVQWHKEERAVTAARGDRDVFLPVGSRLAQVEGRPFRLDAPAVIVRGVLLVPMQVISDSLGADVKWDYRTQTVRISTAALFARAHSAPFSQSRLSVLQKRIRESRGFCIQVVA
jgi:hypothetical protein